MASRYVPRYLLNDECGHVDLGVFLSITHQGSRDLLRGHQAEVRQKIAVDRVGQIDVEDHTRKVSTVVEQNVEVADVAPVIEDIHDAPVLGRRAVHLKAVDGPVIGFTYQFGPLALRRSSMLIVRSEREK